MGYPVTVEFDKYLTGGILEGLDITETMGFMSWEDACKWAGTCTESLKVDFVITEMRGPNGEVQRF